MRCMALIVLLASTMVVGSGCASLRQPDPAPLASCTDEHPHAPDIWDFLNVLATPFVGQTWSWQPSHDLRRIQPVVAAHSGMLFLCH
jgi:hypothetical protein